MEQASLSLPGSPFNLRRGSRGSQLSVSWRSNGRRLGDRKPLVLQTYRDAQEHLPYADDSNAVTPMSEDNGAILLPMYANLASRHSSYTSHSSRLSYTSHGGDVFCRGGAAAGAGPGAGGVLTKESQLRSRSRNLQGCYYYEVSLSLSPSLFFTLPFSLFFFLSLFLLLSRSLPSFFFSLSLSFRYALALRPLSHSSCFPRQR